MRIGIDASNLRAGGGRNHLIELLWAARPEKYGITKVVVWAGREMLAQLPARPWLERAHEPMLDRALPVRIYWQTVRLARLARRRCDCLWIPGGSYSGSFKPFIAMSQNLAPFESAEMWRYRASWLFIKLILLKWSHTRSFRNAEKVIFLTEYARSVIGQAARLGESGGQQPIIPYGLSRRFDLPPRTQKPLSNYSPQEPFRFLYVSKIEPYKHQWHVVEAMARLRQAGVPVTLDLIGGPECPRSARRLIEAIELVDPRRTFIRYLDHVPHSELTAFYHNSDGFIFASSCESMPNILLEAMAAGLPIACSDRGPMPEVLGEAGVYFDPERPEEIAAALRSLLGDLSLRERCAALAYERAQQYSWERCARETFSALAEATQIALEKKNYPALTQAAMQNHKGEERVRK